MKEKVEEYFLNHKKLVSIKDLKNYLGLKIADLGELIDILYELECEGKIIGNDDLLYMHVPEEYIYKFGTVQKSSKSKKYIKLSRGKTAMITGDTSIIDKDTLVSMNLFGFKKDFINYIVSDFKDFLDNSDLSSDEFFLPSVVFNCIKRGNCKVKVYSTDEKTYGVTYKEDKDDVVKAIESKIKNGIYPEKLWN